MDEKKLSADLYDVLEVIGVSEEMRGLYLERAMIREIPLTATGIVHNSGQRTFYIFGSNCEGTTTPGLRSDVDIMHCDETLPVIEDIEDAPHHGPSLLIVTDNTKPGYVELQYVFNGSTHTIKSGGNIQTIDEKENADNGYALDGYGRIVLKHKATGFGSERNGPADRIRTSRNSGISEQDNVYALRCRRVQSTARDWVHRERNCDWLSKKDLKEMYSYGCFFVGVGHPTSKNWYLEWRRSFSLQERLLMSRLNPTQYKTYVLLKMINHDMIQPAAGKSISSYHLKTSLLYTIESSTSHDWTRENLISSVLLCLKRLLRWVKDANCPNFFIPAENMFNRLDQGTLNKVASVLDDVLSHGLRYPFLLKCDSVYLLLKLDLTKIDTMSICELKKRKQKRLLEETVVTAVAVYNSRNQFMDFISYNLGPEECLSNLRIRKEYLQTTVCITEHTTRDVRLVLDSIIPHIHLQIAQSMVSDLLTCRGTSTTPSMMSTDLLCHILKGADCDTISARLILATYYLRTERFAMCEQLLQACENTLKGCVISICGCHAYPECMYFDERQLSENASIKDYRRQYTAGCMLFLPSQASLVHPALQYEMYRSVFSPPDSRDNHFNFLYGWSVVDSKVYMIFLQYILYTKTNNILRPTVVDKMRDICSTDQNIGHRDAAYNVLGWIYTKENKIPEAFQCFKSSMGIKPMQNAAILHIAVLLFTLTNDTSFAQNVI